MYTSTYTRFILNKDYYLSFIPPDDLHVLNIIRLTNTPLLDEDEHEILPKTPFRTIFRMIKKEYSEIFTGDVKHLIIMQKPNGKEFDNLIKGIEECGKKFTDFLIMRLGEVTFSDSLGDFYVPEDFFEYMSGIVFRKRGYLVGKPILPSSDDAGAYLYPSLVSFLKDKGIIEENGAFFGEIALSEKEIDLNEIDKVPIDEEVEFIYIEAKSKPYVVNSEGFEKAKSKRGDHHKSFATGPLTDVKRDDVGTISFTLDGSLFFNDAKERGYVVGEKSLQNGIKIFVKQLLS